MKRLSIIALVLTLLAATAGAPVSAGGWVTVEIKEPIENAVVGEVVAFNIIVQQHGVHPVNYDRVIISATHAESGVSIDIPVEATSETGHYRGEVIFAEAGRWKMRGDIPAMTMGTAFPTVYVHESTDNTDTTKAVEVENSAEVVEVNIIGSVFTPGKLSIEPGATVRFTNQDSIRHEVAFADASVDDSGILDPNASWEYTFEEPGRYTFVCGPHLAMSGVIEVGEP